MASIIKIKWAGVLPEAWAATTLATILGGSGREIQGLNRVKKWRTN